MAAVSLRGLGKSFGPVHVIHDVNLEIGDGEFMVLVGPSGCGKSTLLRMIAGLETITAANCGSADASSTTCLPKERDIAMVFQSYALYPHMTVRENMGFSLKLSARARRPRSRRGSRRAAEMLGLERSAGALPARSSRAASASASPWGARSCATRRSSCSTSRCPISTPRCACRCASRSRELHQRLRRDDDLRHARPGRGDDAGAEDRGAEQGAGRAGRRRRSSSTTTEQPLRRALHRLAADERSLRESVRGGRWARRSRHARRRRTINPNPGAWPRSRRFRAARHSTRSADADGGRSITRGHSSRRIPGRIDAPPRRTRWRGASCRSTSRELRRASWTGDPLRRSRFGGPPVRRCRRSHRGGSGMTDVFVVTTSRPSSRSPPGSFAPRPAPRRSNLPHS